MNLPKILPLPLFALTCAHCLVPPALTEHTPTEFFALSAYLGLNTTDPWVQPTRTKNDAQLTLSARAQAQLNLPLGRSPVFPSLGGYLTGEPDAWEGGGYVGINWKRNDRETFGCFGGLLEKGHFDRTLSPEPPTERWHGAAVGIRAGWRSRRFPRLGYVGLASLQFKESYRSGETSTGGNAYLGLEYGLI